jgi:translation elongation factor EF-Ts
MFDRNQIKETQKVLTDVTSQIKTMQEKLFPDVVNGMMNKLAEKDKALFQEFAKESSKILSDTLNKQQTDIEGTLQELIAKYEQRINNT